MIPLFTPAVAGFRDIGVPQYPSLQPLRRAISLPDQRFELLAFIGVSHTPYIALPKSPSQP